MQTYDRMGIHLEQCGQCRGIFLDHGELEDIISAEQRHYGSAPPRTAPPPAYRGRPDSPAPYQGGGYGYRDSPRPYGYADSPGPYGRRRRKSFLENLFD